MQILGAQYQSRRIRFLAGFTFLLWVFIIPNGHVIYLMGHQEEFWRYHDGQWLRAMFIAVVASAIIALSFSRKWGIITLTFSAMVILAPLVANASLSGYQTLPDISWQHQQQLLGVWTKELMVAITGTLICAAFWKEPPSEEPANRKAVVKPRQSPYPEIAVTAKNDTEVAANRLSDGTI